MIRKLIAALLIAILVLAAIRVATAPAGGYEISSRNSYSPVTEIVTAP